MQDMRSRNVAAQGQAEGQVAWRWEGNSRAGGSLTRRAHQPAKYDLSYAGYNGVAGLYP